MSNRVRTFKLNNSSWWRYQVEGLNVIITHPTYEREIIPLIDIKDIGWSVLGKIRQGKINTTVSPFVVALWILKEKYQRDWV